VIGAASLWLGVAGRALAERWCAELEGAKPQARLEYLQRDRSTLDASCIISAMVEISLAIEGQSFDRYAEAVKILVEYLDYRPDESKLSRAVSRNRDPYPATEALSAIGKLVLPDVIDAIASPATSDIGRFNAIVVVFEIYIREDLSEAVRVLKRAAKAKDPADSEGSQRLVDAARKTAGMCRGLTTNACMDALYSKDEK
jgi:hypothetical protein